jgi:hypothetical protein
MILAEAMDFYTLIAKLVELVVGLIVAFVPLFTLIFTGYLALQAQKITKTQTSLVEGQDKAAAKVAVVAENQAVAVEAVTAVKNALEQTTEAQAAQLQSIAQIGEENKKIGQENHRLNNGAMTACLLIIAQQARQLANENPTPERLATAKIAEKEYNDHRANIPPA